MKTIVWVTLAFAFLSYGIYDLYLGVKELAEPDLETFQCISKIVIPSYIIGSSIYILYLKLIKKHDTL